MQHGQFGWQKTKLTSETKGVYSLRGSGIWKPSSSFALAIVIGVVLFAATLLFEAICISCTGLGRKHRLVNGTRVRRVARLLGMDNLSISCIGFDRTHVPLPGTDRCVQRPLEVANFSCCSGCDRKHRPVLGTPMRVKRLLDMANLMCCSGFDRKHRPVHGLCTGVCVLLGEVRE